MPKRIIPKNHGSRRIRDTSITTRRIDPSEVARALGAENADNGLEVDTGPLGHYRLQSSNGSRNGHGTDQ